LIDVEHTRNNGYRFSEVYGLNDAGQFLGYSYRYNGRSTDLGRSAWLYNGTMTLKIGLAGTEHIRNDGYKDIDAIQLNKAGQVIGESERFNGGSASLGQSAWLYNGTTSINIGLTDSEHTHSSGRKSSSAYQLNEAGQVIGTSGRSDGGSASLGQSAWLYNGTTTIKIGLSDAEHTRDDDHKISFPIQLNQAGQVIGSSYRYYGVGEWGESAWLYDGKTTLNIGLTGAMHTRNNGIKYSYAEQLNEAGQVIGRSNRYNGSSKLGQDAWVYDPILGTVSLQFSVRDDGYAFSQATFLGDDGVVLGYYNLYDGANLVGERALYWSRSDGLHDLGLLVDGGLSAQGWAALYRTIQNNGDGKIIGYGAAAGLPAGSQSAYLLTRAVDVPGDFDSDGDVDGADFVAWQLHYPIAAGATRADGDADGDGDVDGADFVAWQTNLSFTSGASASPVPEPKGIAMVFAACVTVLISRGYATAGR
jgi:hypothetical protein